MSTPHPLRESSVMRTVARAASAHLGKTWTPGGFTDLNERASHPCGIFHGAPFSVFAKLNSSASDQFGAELRGLALIRSAVTSPTPIADGIVEIDAGSLLLLEALPEVPAERRSAVQWRAVGRALATLHAVRDPTFGLVAFDGFFGPLPQDNRPVASNRWADFYAERRVLPYVRSAVDGGHLPLDLAAGVERIVARLPALCGPEPTPSLLHGDAQQNNVLTTENAAVLLDPAPYFGHPELDLALLDYFAPVPDAVFEGYRDHTPIDAGLAERRELWRLFGYLAVVTVDGDSTFGRPFVDRVAGVVARYA